MKRRIWTIAVGLAASRRSSRYPPRWPRTRSPSSRYTDRNRCRRQGVPRSERRSDSEPWRSLSPSGTQLTTSQAPGTVLGPVRAIVKALDLAGADLPLEGQLVVAAPGQVSAANRRGASGRRSRSPSWVMVLTAAGQTLSVPTYLVSTTGTSFASLGPAFIGICLPPPDLPVGTPGRATFGAKVYSAELAVNGVFSKVATGAWISFWVPYTPGSRQAEPGRVSSSHPRGGRTGRGDISAKRSGKGRRHRVALRRAVSREAARRSRSSADREVEADDAQESPCRSERRSSATKFAKSGRSSGRTPSPTGGAAPPLCTQLQPLLGRRPASTRRSTGSPRRARSYARSSSGRS